MRIRVNDPVHDWLNAFVAVEGVPIWNCVEADTDEGWAEVLASDDAGNFVVEGEEVKHERLHGRVTVTFTHERGGISKCPVCRRFTHTKDCPVRETMALTWTGTPPDDAMRDRP